MDFNHCRILSSVSISVISEILQRVIRILNLKIFFILSLATPCLAANLRYKIEGFEVEFEKPNGYQALRGYLGRDLVLLGPERTQKRSTIFLEVTSSNRISLEEEKKKKNDFKNIKTEWIKEKKAILNNFKLDKKLNYLKNDYLFHEVSYSMKGVKFIEGDLFYRCSPEVTTNISFLVEEKRIKAFRGVFKRYLSSLACR